MTIYEILCLILGSGGIGSAVTYVFNWKANKRLKESEVLLSETETADRQGIMHKDKFESMYNQINKMIKDYNDLSNDYRKYRDDALERERHFLNRISTNVGKMSEMRAEIEYLKPLRCYNTQCKYRQRNNLEK